MPDKDGENPQNFWQFLLVCFAWIGGRATRLLAVAQGSLAILAAQENLIPKEVLPYLMLAIALLTFWRGQSTAKVYANAQAIVKQASTPDVVLPDPLPTEPKKP